jgi:hypothetical protein
MQLTIPSFPWAARLPRMRRMDTQHTRSEAAAFRRHCLEVLRTTADQWGLDVCRILHPRPVRRFSGCKPAPRRLRAAATR